MHTNSHIAHFQPLTHIKINIGSNPYIKEKSMRKNSLKWENEFTHEKILNLPIANMQPSNTGKRRHEMKIESESDKEQ